MARTVAEIMKSALKGGLVIPAFNIPYIPMMEAVVRALRDTGTFGLIAVARPEWEKFQAKSMRAIAEEYARVKDERHMRLHLDHIPVIDEDHKQVDYAGIIAEAIGLGYHSVMVDGSRLALTENIQATKRVVAMGHKAGIPVEAELGAVLGHEAGPVPPYEELMKSGKGFTAPEEARRFVQETGVDWLSVAIGNIHGAISGAAMNAKKVEARLDIAQLQKIRQAIGADIPLVLHGGSGIRKEYILQGIRNGIAKINVGMAIRQPYQVGSKQSVKAGQDATYQAVIDVIRGELEIGDSARVLNPG
jgi:ketose-bisphosphate aldolase